jgi:methionyl-tRNA synthetase
MMMSGSKPEITYEDFTKLDIRTGTIVAATPVPKSKKLLQLDVHFGAEVGNRVILAGIAEMFTETYSLIGQQIIAVINLTPRSMMGITSHGMILAGKWQDGRINLVQCMGVPDGGTIG